jgi:hypothetical protein
MGWCHGRVIVFLGFKIFAVSIVGSADPSGMIGANTGFESNFFLRESAESDLMIQKRPRLRGVAVDLRPQNILVN